MKTIAIFTQNLDIGGVQKSVFLLSNYLKDKFDIKIILAEDNKNINYNIQDIEIFKIKTKKINIEEENIGEKLFNYRVKELTTLLEKIKPHLLISYEDYNNLIALESSFSCKKIISCRVSIFDSYQDKKIHLLSSEFYYNKIKNLYPKANKIITVSNSIKNELEDIFHINNSITIHNGILKIKTFTPCNYSNFILNIGRLHKQKGQLDLIKAFNKIKTQIKENLLIVGEGVLRAELENEIEKLNLKNRVFLIGADLPYSYIKNCSLFVFPSYYEGFSNTILEVMSLKKNILAYNYKGSKEVLFNENLIEKGNIEELSLKIVFYLKNKKENKLLEDKLFMHSKKFSLNKTLQKYEEEIKKCVEL
ncbi:glycosyltransferase [Malaciobacter mytili]|uniref:glycosyltransferase n=2 Tax=Malaciobacter mytili TaxID=603050 RepID=UPI003BAEDB14